MSKIIRDERPLVRLNSKGGIVGGKLLKVNFLLVIKFRMKVFFVDDFKDVGKEKGNVGKGCRTASSEKLIPS